MLSLLKLITNKNDFFIGTFLFLSYSFGIGRINTLIQTPSSPGKRYPIPDQNGKSVCPFSEQNSANTTPLGAARTLWLIERGYTTGKDIDN